MSVDKNLFLYDLAVVAIFKDEARYLREWLDYHLAAGVEHFYLYNNDSSDDYATVLAPYVKKIWSR
ncbi:MAG: glycosyltransferase family 92 protein [Selenomonadaceae bacterium]|nr:glycosyltransferase family 92 protein [Selenomonadaceae bacterium]